MKVSLAAFKDEKFESGKQRKCWMCGCVITRLTATVDHLIPQTRGGKDHKSNLRLACEPCNNKRGSAWISKTDLAKARGHERTKGRDYSALSAAIKRHNEACK